MSPLGLGIKNQCAGEGQQQFSSQVIFGRVAVAKLWIRVCVCVRVCVRACVRVCVCVSFWQYTPVRLHDVELNLRVITWVPSCQVMKTWNLTWGELHEYLQYARVKAICYNFVMCCGSDDPLCCRIFVSLPYSWLICSEDNAKTVEDEGNLHFVFIINMQIWSLGEYTCT
jgi:hypothetical protein